MKTTTNKSESTNLKKERTTYRKKEIITSIHIARKKERTNEIHRYRPNEDLTIYIIKDIKTYNTYRQN